MNSRTIVSAILGAILGMLVVLAFKANRNDNPGTDFAYLNIGSRSYRIYPESAHNPTEDLKELCDTSLKGAGFREITFKDDTRTRYLLTLMPWTEARQLRAISVLTDLDDITKSMISEEKYDKWMKTHKK